MRPSKFLAANLLVCLLLHASALRAVDTIQPGLPSAAGAGAEIDPRIKPLDYPADIRAFRVRALDADGAFAPDIAFSITHCARCKKPYVFGIFPRLSRKPFDALADVHKVIETTARKPAPQVMFSARDKRLVPRACPYCGEPEHNAAPTRVYFCHLLPETGDDLQIDYTILNGAPSEHKFWRVRKGAAAENLALANENETAFKATFGCHFSLRAVWREIFEAHWDSDKVVYENVAPGMNFVFRPEKVSDDAFRDFADKILKPERDKGIFARLESPLKVGKNDPPEGTYLEWAGARAGQLSKGSAECFVALSLSEMRSAAVSALASRNATLNLKPGKPTQPGIGFLERGPLKIPATLAPLIQSAVLGGFSLQQICALELADGSYTLDAAENIGKAIQAALPECDFDFSEGRFMLARDTKKQERKLDLLTLAGKLDPRDSENFSLYCVYILRWDKQAHAFGPAPKDFEISPIGLPAFVEKRIKPADFFAQKKALNALFEPGTDSDGKRFDFCYTSECPATVVYIDPANPRFNELPDVNAARLQYALHGDALPFYVEAQDALNFPGGLPGLLECRAAIVCGVDVASLAADEGRATQLADFCEIQDDTRRVHFYALSTNCAVVAPRQLSPDELNLIASRKNDLLRDAQADPGLELNLHFDLPRAQSKGKVLRRKK